jgi:hypothetical protein
LKTLRKISVLTTATQTEWVYLVEPVEHLQEKDAAAIQRSVELQEDAVTQEDVVIPEDAVTQEDVLQALVEDQEAQEDATALDADMLRHLDLDLDVDHQALDVDHQALDVEA